SRLWKRIASVARARNAARTSVVACAPGVGARSEGSPWVGARSEGSSVGIAACDGTRARADSQEREQRAERVSASARTPPGGPADDRASLSARRARALRTDRRERSPGRRREARG